MLKAGSNNCGAYIAGTGSALPEKIITNADLEKMVETSDEWIRSRSGIAERRILEKDKSSIDLSEKAARLALEAARLKPEDLDLIIVATITPDYPTPAAACLLQERLGAKKAAAMDLSAGCTGFVYALSTAAQFVSGGSAQNALVLGTEILSRVTDWQDRSTCVLFGDGSGAAVLKAGPSGRGLIDFDLRSDGSGAELLIIPAGGSKKPASPDTVKNREHTIKMKGNDVFKFAVRVIEESLAQLLNRNDLEASDLKALFLHQANNRIIEHVRKRLKLDPEKVPVNIERYGNTSSATVPILLDEVIRAGKINQNDLIALVAFGSGLTWGSVLIRW